MFVPDSKSEVDLPSSSPVIAANEGYSRTELLLWGGDITLLSCMCLAILAPVVSHRSSHHRHRVIAWPILFESSESSPLRVRVE